MLIMQRHIGCSVAVRQSNLGKTEKILILQTNAHAHCCRSIVDRRSISCSLYNLKKDQLHVVPDWLYRCLIYFGLGHHRYKPSNKRQSNHAGLVIGGPSQPDGVLSLHATLHYAIIGRKFRRSMSCLEKNSWFLLQLPWKRRLGLRRVFKFQHSNTRPKDIEILQWYRRRPHPSNDLLG